MHKIIRKKAKEKRTMAIKIYIDQGHNPTGFNTGAEGNGFFEQDITYRVGKLLYDRFAANSAFEPRLSRPVESTILGNSNNSSLRVRVEQANAFGADLFISIHTVITHRRNIARKLEIHSPTLLTVYAIVNKLVDISEVKLSL